VPRIKKGWPFYPKKVWGSIARSVDKWGPGWDFVGKVTFLGGKTDRAEIQLTATSHQKHYTYFSLVGNVGERFSCRI